MRCPVRFKLALCAVLACLAIPASALAAPRLPLGHSGRWITDAGGRVVVMHGTNMVYKIAPFYPAAAPFGASDAAFLRSIGFTAVRVGVLWQAVEPQPGVYDDAYLNHIAATVNTLARYGIFSLLDFHQDQYNQEFAGEGFPTWSVEDDGLPNTMTAFPTGYEVNTALQRAFENFWADKPGPGGVGLQERYAAAWKHVAQRFRGDRSVLGYEIMNEPFPGSDYVSCASPAECPGSDAELTTLERKVDRAIRSVDKRTLVFHEPYVTFNFGYQDGVGALNDPRAVFAWHNYCLTTSPCSGNTTDFQNAEAHIRASGEAQFLTEFGAGTQASENDLIVSLADQNMVPWMYWSYCTCSDPTGSSDEGIVLDPSKPKTTSNLRTSIVDEIVEPYPQVIAGTPRAWGFNRSTSTFSLRYSTARVSRKGSFAAGSLTEIATPAWNYPHGYGAQVRGGAVVSAPRATILLVAACPGARNITVTVAPGRRRSGSCRAHLHIGVRPDVVRLDQPTTYHFAVTATVGSYSEQVAGATVSFGGRTTHTDRHGRAAIRVTLNGNASAYTATARAAGFVSARLEVPSR